MYTPNTVTIKHKGKEIAYIDYRNLKRPEQFKEKVQETLRRTKYYHDNNISGLLVLTDLTGAYIFGDSPKYLQKSTQLAKPYVKKSAVIGISGAKRVLLNFINKISGLQTRAFSDIEDAKDWLVQ